MLSLRRRAAEPGWSSGAATPPSCSPRLASPVRRLCCRWRRRPRLTVIHPGVTLGSVLLSFQPCACKGCGMALLSKPLSKSVWGLLNAGGLEGGAGCWVSLGGVEQAGEQWLLVAMGKAQWSKGTFSSGSPQRRCWVSQGNTTWQHRRYPHLRAGTKGGFAAKAHQIIKQRGGNKNVAFSMVCGLMLFIRYLENWDESISKSPCFTGLSLKIGSQNMWFAVFKKKNQKKPNLSQLEKRSGTG